MATPRKDPLEMSLTPSMAEKGEPIPSKEIAPVPLLDLGSLLTSDKGKMAAPSTDKMGTASFEKNRGNDANFVDPNAFMDLAFQGKDMQETIPKRESNPNNLSMSMSELVQL